MKKYLLLIILAVFLVAPMGCEMVQVKEPQTQEVMVEMAARHLAYHLALAEPEIIAPGLLFCSAFVEAGPDQVNPLLGQATDYLEGKIGNDLMLLADLKQLAKLLGVNIEMPKIDIEKHRLLKVAIAGFRNGLLVAQGGK